MLVLHLIAVVDEPKSVQKNWKKKKRKEKKRLLGLSNRLGLFDKNTAFNLQYEGAGKHQVTGDKRVALRVSESRVGRRIEKF